MRIERSIPEDDSQAASTSAAIINEFSDQALQLLKDHPVNISRKERGLNPMNAILVRDAGSRLPNVKSFYEKYGISFGCIVDMPVEMGICKILGTQPFKAGSLNDYKSKALACAGALRSLDGIYVHIKGPDEFGHDGDAIGKKHNIEEIDRLFFRTLLEHISLSDTMIVISGDHSTPCVSKAHTDDPIPILFSGGFAASDGSLRFTEEEALKGSKGMLNGSDVLSIIVMMRANIC